MVTAKQRKTARERKRSFLNRVSIPTGLREGGGFSAVVYSPSPGIDSGDLEIVPWRWSFRRRRRQVNDTNARTETVVAVRKKANADLDEASEAEAAAAEAI